MVGTLEMKDLDDSITNRTTRQASFGRDDQTLTTLGKVPVLRRNFGLLSMLGFGSTVMLTWEGVLALLNINLLNGGSAGSVYGYILVWLGSASAYSSMAELASMAPTAGAQYHWVAILAPPKFCISLSYFVGWLALIGWQSVVASGAFLCAQLTQGLIILNHGNYTEDPWRVLLFTWAALLLSAFTNTIVARLLPKLESIILIIHVLGYVGVLVPLLYFGSTSYRDATTVFKSFTNGGAWSTQGLSFMFGLVGPMFSLAGPDSVVHMSEEIKSADKTVPCAMVYGIIINGILGFGILIAALFCLGGLDVEHPGPTQYLFMAMFQQVVGNNAGASVMIAIVMIMDYAATLSFLASASRVTWSFARDRGIPGWQVLKRVERKTTLPLWSIGLTCTISVLLSLIILGSLLALNDVLSLTLAGQYATYLVGNSLLMWRRINSQILPFSPTETGLRNTTGVQNLTWGPWRIPEPWGTINNFLRCAYLLVTLFFSFWPTAINPDAAGMNYSSLMLGALLIFSGAYYLFLGRKTFHGPVVEVTREGRTIDE